MFAILWLITVVAKLVPMVPDLCMQSFMYCNKYGNPYVTFDVLIVLTVLTLRWQKWSGELSPAFFQLVAFMCLLQVCKTWRSNRKELEIMLENKGA